ncbi:hypothetical protein IWX90DRAFT_441381 [Phyllosticta citrichinensis]|uniref:Ribosomal protein S21 n=1 Tax=Phyllosticta citrichinensis TaxID=1130410 RepID=A0ABR1XM18_9PEZI
MGVRRVGEALLRSHPTNLFSAVSRPTQQRSRLLSNRNVSRHISETSRRTFSSSTSRPQQNSPKEDDSPPRNSTKASESPSGQEQPQQDRKIANALSFGNILNSTLGRSGVNGETKQRATSGSGSNDSKQPKPSSFDFLRSQAQKGSSLDDAGTQHAAAITAQRASSTKQPSNLFNMREMLKNTVLERKQGTPPRSGAWRFPAGSASAAAAADVKHSLMEPPDVDNLPRLGPSYGRTVAVYENDLPGALRRMDMRVNSNGIRKAYHSQKFHERPGLKRKRLASARWRNRFMHGFRATVQTVKHLKRQGW